MSDERDEALARAKAAPRARATLDVARPRTIWLAAGGAAAGAALVIGAGATPPGGASHPLGKPHAKLACETCHTSPETAKTGDPKACKTCHAGHASARAGHRAQAAKGALTCMTCHPAHAGAQGVTFAESGAFVRWGAGVGAEKAGLSGEHRPKTTVPLVSLHACEKCHDPYRAADPIAACVSAVARATKSDPKTTPSLCFDEHQALALVGPAAAGARVDRFVAWDAARDVATTTAWVPAKAGGTGSPWLPLGGALGGAAILGLVGGLVERRRRAPRAPGVASSGVPASATVPAARKRLPVVDTSTCLGCYACVDACPFDVLQIERYVAVVARPEECCGVVLCEQVCPNGSLRVDEGEVIVDRARTDDHLESLDVPGLFLAGDLTGLPLIKNAINQGVRVVDRVATTLRRTRDVADVLVIGAGPAGLSAALRAKEKGLSCVVLEQATIAASVKSFPRDKLVYDPPLDLPVEGELWLREATKEELLAQWTRIVRARGLDVREGRRVSSIAKDGDTFVVETEGGGEAGDAPRERYRAARVVVAIGRRGTPRKLDLEVEPGAESRIAYALADARSFAGKKVLVVGLGDSAMEAAIALARQPGTTVSVSYRGASFKRGKQRNVGELQDLVAKGRARLLFETVPVAMTRSGVTLQGPRGRRVIAIDAMIVLVGGVPSWDLLIRAGVKRPARPDRKETEIIRVGGP